MASSLVPVAMRAALQAALRTRSLPLMRISSSYATVRKTPPVTPCLVEQYHVRRFCAGADDKRASTPPSKEPEQNHFNATVTVANVLEGRKEKVFSTTADSIVFDAVKTMVDRNIGSLIVVDENHKPVSILTERDYLEKVIVLGRTSKTTKVKDIMSEKALVCVSSTDTLNHCMELMAEKRVRHIPVVDEGKIVGLVSIGDVVKELTASYKRNAAHMEHFIAGGY